MEWSASSIVCWPITRPDIAMVDTDGLALRVTIGKTGSAVDRY